MKIQRFLSQKVRETAWFRCCFCTFLQAGGLFASFETIHHHPLPGRSPRQKSAHRAVSEPPSLSLALSKWRCGASDYGHKLPSLLLVTWGVIYDSQLHGYVLFYSLRIRVNSNFTILTPLFSNQGPRIYYRSFLPRSYEASHKLQCPIYLNVHSSENEGFTHQ